VALATILVVDDTAELLEFTAAALDLAGYRVVCCDSGPEALTALSNGHAFDLLVTDIAMPKINGFELARRARERWPSLPIAYVTGDAQLAAVSPHEVFGPILRKPYRAATLIRKIEELLASSEDVRLVREVAADMIKRFPNAYDRATDEEELARLKDDDLSADAWKDIAQAIWILRNGRGKPD
jgi:CheY-like chemotaxis protein